MQHNRAGSASANPIPPSFPFPEILTIEQAAEMLNLTRRQCYEMTRSRGRERMPIPIPLIRINGNIRFRRNDLAKWLDQLAEYERTGRVPVEVRQ